MSSDHMATSTNANFPPRRGLPAELWSQILSYLDQEDLITLGSLGMPWSVLVQNYPLKSLDLLDEAHWKRAARAFGDRSESRQDCVAEVFSTIATKATCLRLSTETPLLQDIPFFDKDLGDTYLNLQSRFKNVKYLYMSAKTFTGRLIFPLDLTLMIVEPSYITVDWGVAEIDHLLYRLDKFPNNNMDKQGGLDIETETINWVLPSPSPLFYDKRWDGMFRTLRWWGQHAKTQRLMLLAPPNETIRATGENFMDVSLWGFLHRNKASKVEIIIDDSRASAADTRERKDADKDLSELEVLLTEYTETMRQRYEDDGDSLGEIPPWTVANTFTPLPDDPERFYGSFPVQKP